MAIFLFFKMAAARRLGFVLRTTTRKQYFVIFITEQNFVGIFAAVLMTMQF